MADALRTVKIFSSANYELAYFGRRSNIFCALVLFNFWKEYGEYVPLLSLISVQHSSKVRFKQTHH